jgi:hypothetical protein
VKVSWAKKDIDHCRMAWRLLSRLWPVGAEAAKSATQCGIGCKRKQGDKPRLSDSACCTGNWQGGCTGVKQGGEADAHHLDLARRRRGNTAQVLADQLKTVC